jgi:hypothetical protein
MSAFPPDGLWGQGRSLFTVRARCLREVLGSNSGSSNDSVEPGSCGGSASASDGAEESGYGDMRAFMADWMGVFLDALHAGQQDQDQDQGQENENQPQPQQQATPDGAQQARQARRTQRAAREILVWLRDLCDRWGVPYDQAAVDGGLALFQQCHADNPDTDTAAVDDRDRGQANSHSGLDDDGNDGDERCGVEGSLDTDEMYLDPFTFRWVRIEGAGNAVPPQQLDVCIRWDRN